MKTFDALIIFFSLLSMAMAFLLSFWPFVPLGIALLVLYGRTALGISSGLFFDLLYGPPVGPFSLLHFPFLLFAVLCVGLRIVSLRFILPRGGFRGL